MNKQANTISPADVLAMYRMSKLSDADERNRARVLMEQGVEDPITSMRNTKWRVLGDVLKRGLKTSAWGALAGAATGYGAGDDGHKGIATAGGAVIGAGVGAALNLLVSAITGIAGGISGSISKTDPQRIADFYSGKDKATPYNAAFAGSQLDKAVQERQARYQMEAPYQVVH